MKVASSTEGNAKSVHGLVFLEVTILFSLDFSGAGRFGELVFG